VKLYKTDNIETPVT